MTDRPTPQTREEGPQFRPRPGPLRLLSIVGPVVVTSCLVFYLVGILLVSNGHSGLRWIVPINFLLGIAGALTFGLYLHAYWDWGAFGLTNSGRVCTGRQLREEPAFHRLPALSALPRRTVILLYVIPVVLAGVWMASLISRKQQELLLSTERLTQLRQSSAADAIGFTRASCRDFPPGSVQPASLCFVAWSRPMTGGAGAGQAALETNVLHWIKAFGGSVEGVDFRHGGGVQGGQWVVSVNSFDKWAAPIQVPFTVLSASRQDERTGEVPPGLTQVASWLRGQAFHSVLIVTPGASSPGVTAP